MAAVLSPLLAGDRFAEMADLDSTCETLEIRLNRDDSLSPDDSINLQTELTNLHYRLDCEKKLEAQKARLADLLNVLFGLFVALTVLFFLTNRGSGKDENIWIVLGLGAFTLVLVAAKRIYLKKVAKLKEVIEEKFSSENLVKSN